MQLVTCLTCDRETWVRVLSGAHVRIRTYLYVFVCIVCICTYCLYLYVSVRIICHGICTYLQYNCTRVVYVFLLPNLRIRTYLVKKYGQKYVRKYVRIRLCTYCVRINLAHFQNTYVFHAEIRTKIRTNTYNTYAYVFVRIPYVLRTY